MTDVHSFFKVILNSKIYCSWYVLKVKASSRLLRNYFLVLQGPDLVLLPLLMPEFSLLLAPLPNKTLQQNFPWIHHLHRRSGYSFSGRCFSWRHFCQPFPRCRHIFWLLHCSLNYYMKNYHEGSYFLLMEKRENYHRVTQFLQRNKKTF